jgi:hypothetical protein
MLHLNHRGAIRLLIDIVNKRSGPGAEIRSTPRSTPAVALRYGLWQ